MFPEMYDHGWVVFVDFLCLFEATGMCALSLMLIALEHQHRPIYDCSSRDISLAHFFLFVLSSFSFIQFRKADFVGCMFCSGFFSCLVLVCVCFMEVRHNFLDVLSANSFLFQTPGLIKRYNW
jgi:hypothetical protein